MKINRLLYLTIIYVFYSINCLSQSDYRKGFIITNNNDTVYGMIDYRGNINNALSCKFKHKDDDIPTIYNPVDIKGYRFIDDKYYISKEINFDNKTEFRFLEFLLHGVADIYSYRNQNGIHFFIQKEGEDLIELKETEINTFVSGYTHTIKQKTYIGYLRSLFADAPSIQNKIDNVTLSRKSLIDITMDYHYQVCNDRECIIYKKKLPKPKIEIGPLISINNHSIDSKTLIFRGQHFARLECNFNNITSISYGIFTNITLPYSNGKFAFRYQGIISSYKYSSFYEIKESSVAGIYNYSINSTDLLNYILFRYNILDRKICPVALIGGYLSQKLKVDKSGLDLIVYGDDDFSKNFYGGVSAGFGLAYQSKKNREFFIRILFNRGFDSFDYFNTKEINIAIEIPLIKI